jgi:hypothetical protein
MQLRGFGGAVRASQKFRAIKDRGFTACVGRDGSPMSMAQKATILAALVQQVLSCKSEII